MGFKTAAEHGPPGHETLLWAFSALPLLSQRRAISPYSPFREGFKTAAKHGPPQDTKPFHGPLALCHCLPSAWPCRKSPFRSFQYRCEAQSTRRPFRGPSALCHCFPSAWPYCHSPFRGFQYRCEARSTTWRQNPSMGLQPLPLLSQRLAILPESILNLEGFKTAAKHGPPGHETLLWAFMRFATAFTAPGHVAIVHI